MNLSKFDDPNATWAPLAPGRYCLARCYCGSCPHYVPLGERATNTPDTYTAFDRRAVLSSTGRRANLAEYRQAQREAGLIPGQKAESA
jgi:hypothetical protein